MSWDDYWNGDVWMVVAYNKAEKRRRERKNWELYLMGMYVYEALCDVSPLLHAFAKNGTKAHPYRSEPYPLSGQEKTEPSEAEREKKEENDRLFAMAYMQNMVHAGKDFGKKQ